MTSSVSIRCQSQVVVQQVLRISLKIFTVTLLIVSKFLFSHCNKHTREKFSWILITPRTDLCFNILKNVEK